MDGIREIDDRISELQARARIKSPGQSNKGVIYLRVPVTFKSRVYEAAIRDGESVNAFCVKAIEALVEATHTE